MSLPRSMQSLTLGEFIILRPSAPTRRLRPKIGSFRRRGRKSGNFGLLVSFFWEGLANPLLLTVCWVCPGPAPQTQRPPSPLALTSIDRARTWDRPLTELVIYDILHCRAWA